MASFTRSAATVARALRVAVRPAPSTACARSAARTSALSPVYGGSGAMMAVRCMSVAGTLPTRQQGLDIDDLFDSRQHTPNQFGADAMNPTGDSACTSATP